MKRKQVAFDLDTNELKKHYPKKDWKNTYAMIESHMKKRGFHWIQGSVYMSNDKMSRIIAADIVKDFVRANPWIQPCIRDCRISDETIGSSLNLWLQKGFKEELLKQQIEEQKYDDEKENWEQEEDEWEQEY